MFYGFHELKAIPIKFTVSSECNKSMNDADERLVDRPIGYLLESLTLDHALNGTSRDVQHVPTADYRRDDQKWIYYSYGCYNR